jgi:uncharacterized protein YdiU (UPF0061 family)
MNILENFDWTHSFYELGPDFFQAKTPDPVAAPYIIDSNPDAAALIGLDPAELKRPEIFRKNGIDPEVYAAETPESHIEMHLSCSA